MLELDIVPQRKRVHLLTLPQGTEVGFTSLCCCLGSGPGTWHTSFPKEMSAKERLLWAISREKTKRGEGQRMFEKQDLGWTEECGKWYQALASETQGWKVVFTRTSLPSLSIILVLLAVSLAIDQQRNRRTVSSLPMIHIKINEWGLDEREFLAESVHVKSIIQYGAFVSSESNKGELCKPQQKCISRSLFWWKKAGNLHLAFQLIVIIWWYWI